MRERQINQLGTGVVEKLIEFLLNVRATETNAILFAVEIRAIVGLKFAVRQLI